ncbi:hypothetical protein EX895_003131 [Sporisorium graminicola]|uniref:Uncharacterized protein n=1 Tax=Sporisorium graminicola TaxID=280036 RepID=A0A4U7KTU1_9BASI|nr:hypothetical protein EX895_003131 [Sporisorium graminicola]TKY88035.1 hypothetical protein EX895_003131 [Sporisorium graminicola]
MSLPNQNAPRMRRHKRRVNDDGSQLAHAVRAFVDQQFDESSPLLARQADGANGVGPGGDRGNANPPGMGSFGNTGTGSDSSNGDSNSNSATTPTSTRGSGGRGNSNGNGDTNTRATPTATTTTPPRNLYTSISTSSSPGGIQGLLHTISNDILGGAGSSTSSTLSSTATSTTSSSSSTSTPSTSSSTRSSSSSSSSSSTSIVPITATAVVTATPTGNLSAASASATPKSSSSSAGPIIGIVAGALVGVVVLSGLIGFLFKKYRKQDDPYESNPFDRDAFQRHSAMIPDHFESDEGHGGSGGMSPEMSEHYQQYNNFGPQYESGISAGAAGAMGAMAAHNETGGPRPPTMFAKHAAGVQQNQPQVGAYYKDGDFNNQMPSLPPHSDYHAPPVAAFANHHADQQYLDEPGFGQGHRSISPAPQLPPLAAFGGDPYSIAGVGRGQQQPHNVANPYAHLDRSHSGAAMNAGSFVPGSIVSPGHHGSGSVSSGSESADQRHASINAAEALAAGLAHQSSLNRSASPKHDATMYDTAGRPGTSEGRSGTPDIPNVQQTYAVPGDGAGGHRISAGSQDMLNGGRVSPSGAALRNPFDNPAPHHQQAQPQQQQQQQQQQLSAHQLSVRNLVPNHAGAGGLSAGQRPVSTASSFADPEDAYGGVY